MPEEINTLVDAINELRAAVTIVILFWIEV